MPPDPHSSKTQLQSALMVIPPSSVQHFAAPLREKYAYESFSQGPAHITLMYPFINPNEIALALEPLSRICSQVKPFDLTLDHYGHFETAHYLALLDPTPVINLSQALLSAFPDYPPYEGNYGPDLIPHLTLASLETKEEVQAINLPPAPNLTFLVDKLYLYIGPAEGRVPWVPIAILPFAENG